MHGTIKKMPMAEHHAGPGIGRSGLALIAESPAKYQFARNTIPPRRPHFELGTAAHAAILEPETFWDQVAVPPASVLGKNGVRSTNAYRQWAAEQGDRAIITAADYDAVRNMTDAVMAHPDRKFIQRLLSRGVSEISVFWNETVDIDGEPAEVLLKCRPDYLPGGCLVTDLKTSSKPIGPDDFAREAARHKYHWSAYLTLRGLSIVTGFTHTRYYFVVVSTVPPHDVALYWLSWDDTPAEMRTAEAQVRAAIKTYARCLKEDRWPGTVEPQPLIFPKWALR